LYFFFIYFIADEKKQEIFTDEYIEPYSDVPAFHMSFVLRKLVPINITIENADRVTETVEDMMGSLLGNDLPKSGVPQVSYEAIGDTVDGISIANLTEPRKTDNEDYVQWADIPVLMLSDSLFAFPNNYADAESRDAVVETDTTHPGYARMMTKCPDTWGNTGKQNKSVMSYYYLPNNYKASQMQRSRMNKESLANQTRHPVIITLRSSYVEAITSPMWPQDAIEWQTRTRKAEWPAQSLIDKVVAEGCHYECIPHPKSSNPEFEFRSCFGIAEKTVAKTLSRDQRYCYILFRALCSQEFEQEQIIMSVHLKSIFFRACEQIAPDIWTTKPGACLFYLMDSLSSHIDNKNIPDYFITSNNLIDHLSDSQLLSCSEKMMSLRSQPFSYLTAMAHRQKNHYATNVVESVRDDIFLFKEHRNTRESMLQTLVPISIRLAGEYIRSKNFKQGMFLLVEPG